MKRSRRTINRAALPILLLALAAPLAAQEELGAYAEEVDGQVEVSINGGPWTDLEAGDAVPIDSRISTGFGSEALLAVGESAVIRVKALTRMQIDELVAEEGVERSELTLEVGRIDGEVTRSEERPTEFELRSPTATASVRGTSFSFDGQSLSVTEGSVALVDAYGRTRTVSTGEQSSTDGSTPPANPGRNRAARATTSPYTPGSDDDETPPPGGDVVVDDDGPATLIIDWEFD